MNIFIFFFTAFSLVYTFNPARESRIVVKLPQADIKAPVDQKEPIVVTINSRNEVFLNNKPKTLRDLKNELQSLMASVKIDLSSSEQTRALSLTGWSRCWMLQRTLEWIALASPSKRNLLPNPKALS